MLFNLWILCLIATGIGMFLVSSIADALSSLRQRLKDHEVQMDADLNAQGGHIGWGR